MDCKVCGYTGRTNTGEIGCMLFQRKINIDEDYCSFGSRNPYVCYNCHGIIIPGTPIEIVNNEMYCQNCYKMIRGR